ncbi:MAG: hypothetical protein WAQ24_02075 [Candidatus Saccharimonadales bacterium]
MAKATKQKPEKVTKQLVRNENIQSKNPIRMWVIFIIFLAMAIPLAFGVKAYVGAQQQKSHMAAYLKEKYGKEFVVTNFRVEGGGFAVKGDPNADAYPKDDKTLKFRVTNLSDDGGYSFIDEYPGAVWAKEEHDRLKPVLTKIFGYTPDYKVEVHTIAHLAYDLKGNFGSFQDNAKRYGEKIGMSLTVYSKEKIINDENKQVVVNRFFSLIQELKPLSINTTIYYMGADGTHGIHLESINKSSVDIKQPSDLLIKFSGV